MNATPPRPARRRARLLAPLGLIALAAAGGARAQIDSHSKAPIDITANSAEVVGSKCVTVWRGAAEALQDQTRLRADTITVYFRVKGMGAGGQPDCGATDRMEADGHVFYVTPKQNARGDRAVYSAAADEIVLTGNVIVAQGHDVARGEKLTIKISTREAKMEAGSGRVRGVFYPDASGGVAGAARP